MSLEQVAEFRAAILESLPELSLAEMQEWLGPRRSALPAYLSFLKIAQPHISFSKNEHGHYLVTVIGRSFTGTQGAEALLRQGFRITDYANQCLGGTHSDSYDANHRLQEGRVYTLAIVPGREMRERRTGNNILAYGQRFGYRKSLAGMMPLLREIISDQHLEEMGFQYVAAIHDPVQASDGRPAAFYISGADGGRWLGALWDCPDDEWREGGGFIFSVAP